MPSKKLSVAVIWSNLIERLSDLYKNYQWLFEDEEDETMLERLELKMRLCDAVASAFEKVVLPAELGSVCASAARFNDDWSNEKQEDSIFATIAALAKVPTVKACNHVMVALDRARVLRVNPKWDFMFKSKPPELYDVEFEDLHQRLNEWLFFRGITSTQLKRKGDCLLAPWVVQFYSDSLLFTFCGDEHVWHSRDYWVKRLRFMGPHVRSEDRAFWDSLPDTLVIYRGVHSERATLGLSWTVDLLRASFFARFYCKRRNTGWIVEATISKKDVLGFTNERDEFEVIPRRSALVNLRRIDMGELPQAALQEAA